MRAELTAASFATVDQLFRYKEAGFTLPPFPGYTDDAWGIKAHNRPWIAEAGRFRSGERILEVGGAYSTLPAYLAATHGTESWIGDDFGAYSNETELWQRWGNPDEWISSHPSVRYVKQPFGFFSREYPDDYFDCVFSVSTLEHIEPRLWPDVIRDMLRVTRPGGRQLHSIDIPSFSPWMTLALEVWGRIPLTSLIRQHPLRRWRSAFRSAGVAIRAGWPSVVSTLDRRNLAESYDVVYRFYPPNGKAKPYRGAALSLLLEIHRTA